MHIQIRTVPATSPPDLAHFLGVLADAGVNVVAAGGGRLELGGELAFAPEHDQEDLAMRTLQDAGYRPRLLDARRGDFRLCSLTNEPGQLHGCISEAAEENLLARRVIADIIVGVEPDENGRIAVQVYSVDRGADVEGVPRAG